MIYLSGDSHGDFLRFTDSHFSERRTLSKEDLVIVLGDFGLIWSTDPDNTEERFFTNFFNDSPFTILFIDGNHENFDRLNAMEEHIWHGGRVHMISSNIIHLMRGQVYEIEGKTFFTFGGAISRDTEGGIFEPEDPELQSKIDKAKSLNRHYRINHRSWWKEERPSSEERLEDINNLRKHDNEVDVIFTHDCASSTQKLLNPSFQSDEVSDYLEQIKQTVSFRKWYFGHYHLEKQFGKEHVLYESIVPLCL